MIEVNETLTCKVAELARLELSSEEVTTFTRQLGDVLRYVEKLQELDLSGVEPLHHPFEGAATLRVDQAWLFSSAKILEHAPEVWDGSYKVPPIL